MSRMNTRFSQWMNDSYGQDSHHDVGTSSPGIYQSLGPGRGDMESGISLSTFNTDSGNLSQAGLQGILPSLMNGEGISPQRLGSVGSQFLGFRPQAINPQDWNMFINRLFGYQVPQIRLPRQ